LTLNPPDIKEKLNRPLAAAVNKNEEIFVADTGNNAIKVFDKSGNLTMKFGVKGTGDSELLRPSGIAVNSHENIFVSDTGNNCIKIFDKTGVFIKKLGRRGYGNSEFLNPYHIILDKEDNLYVVDPGNICIKKYNKNLEFVLNIHKDLNSISDIALDNSGNIYAADFDSGVIKIFDKTGILQSIYMEKYLFPRPVCLAMSENNDIGIVDMAKQTIEIFKDNTLLYKSSFDQFRQRPQYGRIKPLYSIFISDDIVYSVYSGKSDLNGNLLNNNTEKQISNFLNQPKSIVVNSKGNIYIADLSNNKIQIFDNNAKYLSSIDLSYPIGLALDKDNNVYVSETGTGAIKKYSPDNTLLETFILSNYFSPGAIAIDSNYILFAVNTLNEKIMAYDTNNKKLIKDYDFGFQNPSSITVDEKNNIYVYDCFTAEITKFKNDTISSKYKINTMNFGRFQGSIFAYKDYIYYFNQIDLQKIPVLK